MATNPSPEPDYGPAGDPQPETAPVELPPIPGDIDEPAAIDEPTPESM